MDNEFKKSYTSTNATNYLNYLTSAYLNGEDVLSDQVIAALGVWCLGRKNYTNAIKHFKFNRSFTFNVNDTFVSLHDLNLLKESFKVLRPIIQNKKEHFDKKLGFSFSLGGVIKEFLNSAEKQKSLTPIAQLTFLKYLEQTAQNEKLLTPEQIEKKQENSLSKILQKFFPQKKIEPVKLSNDFNKCPYHKRISYKASYQEKKENGKEITLPSSISFKSNENLPLKLLPKKEEEKEDVTSTTYSSSFGKGSLSKFTNKPNLIDKSSKVEVAKVATPKEDSVSNEIKINTTQTSPVPKQFGEHTISIISPKIDDPTLEK